MVCVYDYLDYREFLRDYYREKKRTSPFFSYRYIGTKVAMDSSYVIKVLQGRLHIARDRIDRFVKLLGLPEAEGEFFATLVQFGKARTDRERKVFFDRLFAVSTVKSQRLEAHQYEFFQKWHYSAVWAIVDIAPFGGDYRALARTCTPPITVVEARRAVHLLSRLGLIAREGDVWRTTTQNLTTGQKWFSHAIEHYQREMCRLAGESIDRFGKQHRDISTVTLTIAQRALPEIQELVRQFRSSLIKLANGYTDSDRVFQLNVQLFPLSERKGGRP